MQYVGTNLFRNQLHPEIWVTSLMSEYKPYSIPIKDLGVGKGFEWGETYPNFIITDTRFPNELELAKTIAVKKSVQDQINALNDLKEVNGGLS